MIKKGDTNMKTGIERFQQQQAETNRKKAMAAEKLAELKRQRVDLESSITAAIADGDQVTAGKLIRNRMDVDVQIEIVQKTLANLDKPIDREAVSAAWSDDCADYQKQIDKAEKELKQIIRQAVEKALAMSDIVNSAWDARCSALRLVKDQEPYTLNGGNTDFAYVSCKEKKLVNVSELLTREELQVIRPDAAGTISKAATDRSNPYFRRK